MYKILLFLLGLSTVGSTQILQYTPNRKLDKTLAANYYNTEFIFIRNISGQPHSLTFERLDNTLLADWSATICTNSTCYSTLPKNGSFGVIEPEEEAYISLNLAANGALGGGRVRFLIGSLSDTSLHDTVTFKYNVTADGAVKAGPWANLNFAQGVLTVLLDNPNLQANLSIYTLEGKTVYSTPLNPITSIPIRDFGPATYLVHIRDEYDRIINKKIVYIVP